MNAAIKISAKRIKISVTGSVFGDLYNIERMIIGKIIGNTNRKAGRVTRMPFKKYADIRLPRNLGGILGISFSNT
ncbi:hypothetical protein RvVAR0630_22840 [Agrobacterium vitis]|nr:hypothetical protein RvVAR0630_22840 [Agrobacterium vitis]